MSKCYYYDGECRWNCSGKCDEGWDFMAGASPCRRDFWYGLGFSVAVVAIIVGAMYLWRWLL